MVSLDFLSNPSSPMASSHPPSIYSSYSYPYPTSNSRNGSYERLLPATKPVLPKSNLRYVGPRTATRQIAGQATRERMASSGFPVVREQKKSYGIGGAGNIRRPSDVIYPPRTNTDGTRRRTSVWSSITTTSPSIIPEGKRSSLLNMFGRKGSTSAADEGPEFCKESDLGEGRKD